jgi:hypothetical protein
MESTDPKFLIDRLVMGEASPEEINFLCGLINHDQSLARKLREELAFSEYIRHALKDRSMSYSEDLRESLDLQELTLNEKFSLLRDGDLSASAADELARQLLDSPAEAARLRSDLIEEEWIAQIVSETKNEAAFVDSLVTRMWAETQDDKFVKDFSKKLESIEREEHSKIVPFPTSTWKQKAAQIAGFAAAIAIGAFFITSYLAGGMAGLPSLAALRSSFSTFAPAVAKIDKMTADTVWANGASPGKDGIISQGRYQLASGAVSLSLADGKSLAVQGPAVFEVDATGSAVLHEGVALATRSRVKVHENQPIGIGLSAKNLVFSEGAITVGLDARSPDATEAIVFSGKTGICLPGARDCRDVFEFESVKVDYNRDKFVDVPYNPRAFSKAWELISGIEKNLGDIVIELPGVASNTRKSQAGELRVFVERDNFVAETPVEVDAITPGFFVSGQDEVEGKSLAANGQEMRSYLLQMWPDHEAGKKAGAIEASMTFDHPVVGVIFTSDRLWESDQIVRAATGHLVDHQNRGLDSSNNQILLSEDGRTLNLKLQSGQTEINQVRVLVALN